MKYNKYELYEGESHKDMIYGKGELCQGDTYIFLEKKLMINHTQQDL